MLKCVTTVNGDEFVMIPGVAMMLRLPVTSWDSPSKVSLKLN